MQARISRKPGSEITGVPASEISTTFAPRSISLGELAGALDLVALVVRDQARARDLESLEQPPGAPRVLAGDQVGLGERPAGARD